MVAGDTTYVRGGVYNETEIRFKKSGTPSQPIKLLNYPNESPVIDFGLTDYKTPKVPGKFHRVGFANSPTNVAIGWITLEGFEIRRNWVHHNHNQGIIGGGHHILFDRNRINHNGGSKPAPMAS